jgi:hypothetical protein
MTIKPQEKPIPDRLNDMATWAAKTDANLKSMSAAINDIRQMRLGAAATIAPAATNTATELQMAWQYFASPLAELRELRATLVQHEMILAQVNDEIGLAEGNAMLDASMELDDKGKPLYTNEATRKAAAARLLANDESHRALLETKRMSAAAIASTKSDIQYHEDTAKEFMSRSRAIIARLENETAQLSAIKK